MLSGDGEQMVENGGKPEFFTVQEGDLVHIPASVFHQTIGKGSKPIELLAVYRPFGPEAVL